MYSVDSLEYAIASLFRDGVGKHGYTEAEVKELLSGIYYDALLQVVRHNTRTVYAYTIRDNGPKGFNYRGTDLFGQRAALLYEDYIQENTGAAQTSRAYELWLLEDMSLTAAVRVSVKCANGAFATEYREVKDNPWECGMCLNLETLAQKLNKLCAPCFKGNIPVYEL